MTRQYHLRGVKISGVFSFLKTRTMITALSGGMI